MTARLVATVCLSFFLWTSCRQDTALQADLLPDGLNLGVISTDTTSIVGFTVREKPLETHSVSNRMIGIFQDPIFGKTSSSLFTQFRLQTDAIDPGNNVTLDSIVLTLHYQSFYGDIDLPQSLKVYRVTEKMYTDSTYFSNRLFNHDIQEIGAALNKKHNLTDSIFVIDHKEPAHLRIRLDDAFGQEILDKANTVFVDNPTFLDFLKGLYIQADSNQIGGAIIYYNLASTYSRLTLFSNSSTFPMLYLEINSQCVKVSHFKHNYTGWPIDPFLNTPDMIQGASTLYLQSMAGTKAKLLFPNMKNLGLVLISRAELVITIVDDDFNKIFKPPQKLLCLRVDSIGDNAFILDQFEPLSYYGGEKSNEKDSMGNNVTRYRFNLARHFQQIVNGTEEDFGLYLLTFPSPEIADRLIVGGNLHEQAAIKLNLIYTPFSN